MRVEFIVVGAVSVMCQSESPPHLTINPPNRRRKEKEKKKKKRVDLLMKHDKHALLDIQKRPLIPRLPEPKTNLLARIHVDAQQVLFGGEKLCQGRYAEVAGTHDGLDEAGHLPEHRLRVRCTGEGREVHDRRDLGL